ncbi:hypothetical protein KO02_06715 [Sphingobacterium sp. ML3W]|uniref:homing endonuclease associated repeat-containing protein n=1 Tax=Sphingobacterium sp. ML3W TaxID=1538644 RepID=UPI0004F8C10B|nr:hypothetical protein [Sphingobacterium sp. ML3W]AIM36427.1 hypothetical protein KO02_06715 [Sphingobacterium sp. ML3W]
MKETQEKIIANAFSKVRAFYDLHGRTPIRREFEQVNTIARKYFGTWNNFITAAGFKPNVTKSKSEITEELFNLVHEFYKTHKRIPMRREFSNKSSTITKYFGSWNKFIAESGFEPNSRRIPSKIKLKNSLIQYRIKNQKIPSVSDCISKNGLYNFRSYFTHFCVNSWPDVLEYVGLRPYFRMTTMSEPEAKEAVIKLIRKHKILYGKDYLRLKPENYPSLWYLKEKFGWNKLCYLAGTKVPLTKVSVKDHYMGLIKASGKPTVKELAAKMKTTPGAIIWKLDQNLNDFITSIGHEPIHKTPNRCKLTKKQLAEHYKAKSLEHGYENGIPRDKLKELTGYPREVYERRYFSMNGLRLACNLKFVHRGSKRYSEEELWDILKKPKYMKIP